MENHNFRRLIEPIKIGRMEIKNRIVFPPMNTNLTSEDGAVTSELEEYYLRRARGGAGLIVLEASSISRESRNHPKQAMLCDRRYIASWARLVEKIHRYDVMTSIELVHYGSEASIPPRVSPSGISKYGGEAGTILTREAIHKIQEQFIQAAVYAKQAGIDAITLHGCHGYLIAEFLSEAFNKRTDEYGGSFENRCRFLLEIIQGCRERLGPVFPIMVRFSADEFIKGGRGLDESVELAKVLEAHGVDAIDISASQPSAYLMTTPPYCLPQGKHLLVPYSQAIKKAVSIPVFTAIGIREPEEAETILREGKADLICLGRSLLADPDYGNKVKCGMEKDIRHCLSCEYCIDTLDEDKCICCAVNPETGRELEFLKSENMCCHSKKHVVVIGGGPSGMEAARLLAVKGFRVTLLEKQGELGGALNAGSVPPNKEMISKLIDWYKRQLDNLKVEIMLNTDSDEALINELNPDFAVFAGGSEYIRRIPGSENPQVIDVKQALLHPEQVGQNVVIIGGGAAGAEAAEYFTGGELDFYCEGTDEPGGKLKFITKSKPNLSNRHVTIVEMMDEICADMDVFCKDAMLFTLREKGVEMLSSRRVEKIEGKHIYLYNIKEGKAEVLQDLDTIILAGGLKPVDWNGYEGLNCKVIKIGDAQKPGKIKDAIYHAYTQVNRHLDSCMS